MRAGRDPLEEEARQARLVEARDQWRVDHPVAWLALYGGVIVGIVLLGFLAAVVISVLAIKASLVLVQWVWSL